MFRLTEVVPVDQAQPDHPAEAPYVRPYILIPQCIILYCMIINTILLCYEANG